MYSLRPESACSCVKGSGVTIWAAATAHQSPYTAAAAKIPTRNRIRSPEAALIAGLLVGGHAGRERLRVAFSELIVCVHQLAILEGHIKDLFGGVDRPSILVLEVADGLVGLEVDNGAVTD